MDADPPWGPPAGGRADGGGLTGKRRFGQTIGNNGTQSQVRRGLRPTLDRLHGKPRETVGRKTRGYGARWPSGIPRRGLARTALSSFGYRTPLRPKKQRKEV